ncbi:MAG TPA: DsrE family protein [Candidatus Saccharimonadales bacterium]|nr:DsrE family protein [Candidatus Saccharimonadales bacterium]
MPRFLPHLAAACTLALLALTSPASAKDRVLFQWAEGDSMGQLVMTIHANNLLDAVGQDNVELEIITYGPAVFAVTTTRPQTKFADRIKKLTERGVQFRVCHNAMNILGVKDGELLPIVSTVPSAMGEIIKRHDEGWQILKP